MPGDSSREWQGKKEEKMPMPALFTVISPHSPVMGRQMGKTVLVTKFSQPPLFLGRRVLPHSLPLAWSQAVTDNSKTKLPQQTKLLLTGLSLSLSEHGQLHLRHPFQNLRHI